MNRAKVVFGHLNSSNSWKTDLDLESRPTAAAGFPDTRDDDVVIVSALRTPICKAKRGQFKDTLPDDLLSAAFTAVIKDAGINPEQLQDICVGNVLQQGAASTISRIAQFFSGIPETVPLNTVCRFCSSGLQACADISNAIKAGQYDIGMAGGVEAMSINALTTADKKPGFVLNPKVRDNKLASDTMISMGITAENVAERFEISREKQDQMGVDSHAKAAAAIENGWFTDEIIPITTMIKDKDGNEKTITVTQDDGVRPGTTMEGLGKLKPVFKKGGLVTAGNSSQVSDGAAAVILARRSYAKQHGLKVLGVMRSFAAVGVPPDIMGIGPAVAIPAALKKAGLTVSDVDIFEINEAFASQAVYCVEKLGIPMEKVNPKGGAIALGHPVGCTGARQVATLLHELKRRGKRAYGVISMCTGTGMGVAAVLEYPGAFRVLG